MALFLVQVKEVLAYTQKLQAIDKDEAIANMQELYDKELVVLNESHHQSTTIEIVDVK